MLCKLCNLYISYIIGTMNNRSCGRCLETRLNQRWIPVDVKLAKEIAGLHVFTQEKVTLLCKGFSFGHGYSDPTMTTTWRHNNITSARQSNYDVMSPINASGSSCQSQSAGKTINHQVCCSLRQSIRCINDQVRQSITRFVLRVEWLQQ